MGIRVIFTILFTRIIRLSAGVFLYRVFCQAGFESAVQSRWGGVKSQEIASSNFLPSCAICLMWLQACVFALDAPTLNSHKCIYYLPWLVTSDWLRKVGMVNQSAYRINDTQRP